MLRILVEIKYNEHQSKIFGDFINSLNLVFPKFCCFLYIQISGMVVQLAIIKWAKIS